MSKIQWTDLSCNPIKRADGGNYCELKSPGCENCYASDLNSKGTRFGGNGRPYGGSNQAHPSMTLNTDMLTKWPRMRKPKKHFVGSMTDIFGDWVPDTHIFLLLDAMANAPLQTFQILTKRPERMCYKVGTWLRYQQLDQLPANIWLGTSAEDQRCLDERLIWLIRTQAQVRFLSLEPLLGPITFLIEMIDWVIIGGESGANARPARLTWIIDILEQCQRAGIPAFVKQLGSDWARRRVGPVHSKGGDPDEWTEILRVRMFPGEAYG